MAIYFIKLGLIGNKILKFKKKKAHLKKYKHFRFFKEEIFKSFLNTDQFS